MTIVPTPIQVQFTPHYCDFLSENWMRNYDTVLNLPEPRSVHMFHRIYPHKKILAPPYWQTGHEGWFWITGNQMFDTNCHGMLPHHMYTIYAPCVMLVPTTTACGACTLDQNGGNISDFFAGRRQYNDTRHINLIHTWNISLFILITTPFRITTTTKNE